MRKTILVLASVAVALVVLGGVAWAATIQCPNGGRDSHDPDYHLCYGTNSGDTMWGTDKIDAMIGKAGNDTMYGRRHDDSLVGKSGSDKIYGQRGGDLISGQVGLDRLYGGAGSDHIGIERERNPVDTSDDYLHGGADRDNLWSQGLSGVDRLYGEDGNDSISVSQREEIPPANGLPGAPVSKEIVDCGPGSDSVSFDEGVDVVNANCERRFPQ